MIWMISDHTILVEGVVIIITRPGTLELKKKCRKKFILRDKSRPINWQSFKYQYLNIFKSRNTMRHVWPHLLIEKGVIDIQIGNSRFFICRGRFSSYVMSSKTFTSKLSKFQLINSSYKDCI